MELRLGSLDLRLVSMAESIFQMDQRLFPRSSSLDLLDESLLPKYQAKFLEEQ